jgi:peptidyl-prolyl cis-trans isomerase B (cyclophilin B)
MKFFFKEDSKGILMKKTITLAALLFVFATYTIAQVTYTGKPRYQIDVKRGGNFLGTVKIELFPNIAWHHTRNFDSLVGAQFFDSTAFHRVIPGFMIQGGDPNSRHGPTSTWGYGQPNQPTVNAEFSVAKHLRGILSAARSSNINSATSQFFICVAAYPSLNGQYSVYGRVTEGMDVVDTIVSAPRNTSDLPNVKHEMFITAIGSNDTIPVAPVLNSPANNAMGISATSNIMFKWNTVSDAIIYTLEICDDMIFQNIVKTVETPNTIYYLNANTLQNNNTTYYWRVTTNNGGHFSPTSTEWNFTTGTVVTTGIASQTAKSEEICIYPNPSNAKFNFTNLEKGSNVQVYDAIGKIVFETLVKEPALQVDLENNPKGLYLYRISSTTKEVRQGRLILK